MRKTEKIQWGVVTQKKLEFRVWLAEEYDLANRHEVKKRIAFAAEYDEEVGDDLLSLAAEMDDWTDFHKDPDLVVLLDIDAVAHYYRKLNLDGHLGRETDLAMRDYADFYKPAARNEARVDEMVRALGKRPTDLDIPPEVRGWDEQETERFIARVPERSAAKFRAAADEAGLRYGLALTWALDSRMNGGRAGRMDRKFDRIEGTLRHILAEVSPDDADGGLSDKRKKTIAIARTLPAEFTDAALVDAIESVAGTSPQTIEKYREAVTDHRDLERHPTNPDLWVPAEEAAEVAPDGTPRECWLPAGDLDPDGRARRVRLTVGRAAAESSTGKARLTRADVQHDVLDDTVSATTSRRDLDRAAEAGGFHVDETRDGERALFVNLADVRDAEPDLFNEVIAYRDGQAEAAEEAAGAEYDPVEAGPPDTNPGGDADETAGIPTDAGDAADEQATDALDVADGWVSEAVDAIADLPETARTDAVATFKIARAKYPGERDGSTMTDAALDGVTDEDRERVRERLDDTDAAREGVDAELDALDAAATEARVATDGGTPVEDVQGDEQDDDGPGDPDGGAGGTE